MPSVPFVGYARDQEGNGIASAVIQAYTVTDINSNTKSVDPIATTTPDSQTGRWSMFVNTDASPTGYISIKIQIGNIVRWIEGDACMQAQQFFSKHGESPILEDSITDLHIGNRTINQALTPSGNSGSLTTLLSNLANRVRAVSGTSNWFDSPSATLASLWSKFANTSGAGGHTHSGSGNNGPQLTSSGLASNSVTTTKVQNNAITEAKLASAVRTKLNSSGGGGGTPIPGYSGGQSHSSSTYSVSTSMSGNLVSMGQLPAGRYLIAYGAGISSGLNNHVTLYLYNNNSSAGNVRTSFTLTSGDGSRYPVSKTNLITLTGTATFHVRGTASIGTASVHEPWITVTRIL